MKPYMGKVLWVDLTKGTLFEERIPDATYRDFLSGVGLGALLLYQNIPAGADPLGPDNILGFMSGLLSGTGSLFTGRWMAVAKSPLTGTWGDSNGGGLLAFAIKQCGYDGILFRGISPKPVYLLIDSKGPRLEDAAHLWGLDAVETEDRLTADHKGIKQLAVATIGPAGEKCSLLAGIVHHRGRMAARSGLGAVMGSKRLKAVVLSGSQRITAHNPVRVKWLSWKCTRDVLVPLKFITSKMASWFGMLVGKLPVGFAQPGVLLGVLLAKWGTIGTLPVSIGMGDTPFKNWAGTKKDLPQANDRLDPDLITRREKRKYHCRACPIGCGGIIELVKNGGEGHKPEYETTASFTTMLLNTDLDLVYEINEMLNRAGMDSISAGAAVAFAMECYEKGLITQADTGGLDLTWGNSEAILSVVRQMIRREGFGARLADGVQAAARTLPPAAQDSAIHAGGQEIAYHDPRLDPGFALHASVDPTPGRHTSGSQLYYDMYKLWTRVPGIPPSGQFYPKSSRYQAGNGRSTAAAATSNFTQFYSAVGACNLGMLIGVDRVPIFEWTNAATGWDFSPADYLETGRRIQTLRQMFNIREGIDPRRINISRRLIGDPPQASGLHRGISFDLDALMKAYWLAIGWDENTGIPTTETLGELGLAFVRTGNAGEKPR